MGIASNLFVGVDGGGTGCRVAIADARGAVIGTSTGGRANFTSDSEETIRHVLTALTDAASSAGITSAALENAKAHLGLAGVLNRADAQTVAARMPMRQCSVSDDQMTTVFGALGTMSGAVISVGTGSFVAVKRGTDVRTIGGWGLILGDQASGAWIGRGILERCALVQDGLEQVSPLINTMLERFGRDAGAMIAFAKSARPSEFAKLAPEVLRAAEQNDPHALYVLQSGAAYLNQCLTIADLTDDDIICMVGSLGPAYKRWLAPHHHARITDPQGSALDGALHLARDRSDQFF